MSRGILLESAPEMARHHERRAYPRLRLQIPVFVRGKDPEGETFIDLGKTLNISAGGANIICPRPIQESDVVVISVPAPTITSSFLLPAAMPPITARVRRRQHVEDVETIAVEFLKPLE